MKLSLTVRSCGTRKTSRELRALHTRLRLHAVRSVGVGDALQRQERVDGQGHVQREQSQAVHVDDVIACYLQRGTLSLSF